MRNMLEKVIAIHHATGEIPTVWISARHYAKRMNQRNNIIKMLEEDCVTASTSSLYMQTIPPMSTIVLEKTYKDKVHVLKVNAIEHYTLRLWIFNHEVKEMQLRLDEYSYKFNEAARQQVLKQTYIPEADPNNPLETHYLDDKEGDVDTSRHRSHTVDNEMLGAGRGRERSNSLGALGLAALARYNTEDVPEFPENNDVSWRSIPAIAAIRNYLSRYDDIVDTQDQEPPQTFLDHFFHKSKKVALTSAAVTQDLMSKGAAVTSEIVTNGLFEAQKNLMEATKAFMSTKIEYQTSSTAFVTLKSRVSTSVAYQMLLSHENDKMTVSAAPCLTDIIWSNVSVSSIKIATNKTIAKIAVILGALFWSFLVSGIHHLSNLNNFKDSTLQQYEALFNYYLAVCILLSFLTAIPLLFDFIARSYECVKTESEIQNSIMTRYYYYQLANIYITVTAGTIFNSISKVIQNPENILSILGESLPGVSVYFASIVIVMSFACVMFEFIRFWPLLCFYSMTLFRSRKKATRRELRTGAFAPARMLYGWIYPSLLMIFIIIMIYGCISPFLNIFAVIYYTFAFLMYKYQLLYVYINGYQSGGYMWYSVFNRSMTALFWGQMTLLGYLSTRKEYNSDIFYFVFPLPFMILMFWHYCNKTFRNRSMVSYISLYVYCSYRFDMCFLYT
jgi:hypothetical protein